MRTTGRFGRTLVILAAVAFLAALAGVLVGRSLPDPRAEQATALHKLLHDQLDLDPQQRVRIAALEERFAVRHQALELEIRADNARLAAAIQAEHGYGPQVTAEVDRSHAVMGDLQKETLAHIFAMRAVLRPDQAERFDRAVVQALTANADPE
ncbi:periplasmic heavy metal sensor [Sphingosinicella sp. LHD-64]|uniref:periplasmic heavy metal sensor n=1 Tax=Sphingosinicella sp. LHD-64 TaxID=3072139 RepID=UPI00280CB77E|nr:periplasmic heavy metal sensor [Sphingosinicella sp. LHD-64]MDQ8757394.1 periplasmic heavy metal sensor [Sphingosinicella sp. LHD-64]